MEEFYVTSTMARRVYGVCAYAGGAVGLHVVTAHILFGNDIVGGLPLDDDGECGLTRVDEWPDSARGIIEMMPGGPAAFYDPLGWRLLGER